MWVVFLSGYYPAAVAEFVCAICSHTGRRVRHATVRERQSDDAAKRRTHYIPYCFPRNLAKHSHTNKKKSDNLKVLIQINL